MKTPKNQAFSLVEVLAAIAIIGVITFMAIPNIIQIKQDSEDDLARSRAESLNLAIASFVQNRGWSSATNEWQNASTADARYGLIQPYLAFSETNLTAFMPSGYSVTFPAATDLLKSKVLLYGPSSTNNMQY
ncbi:MAG: hypothetical protein Fur0032_24400 [Terrimicrobiaceae bacterium]